jgi:broad specificity phosphatase PhoE
MPKLFLVRHAEHADYGWRLTGRQRDICLTERGRWQAAAVGQRLCREPITDIHTGPCARTVTTAQLISGYVNVPVREADALDEIDFGDWTGSTFAELDQYPEWRHWNAARSAGCPPGGETMAAAVTRIQGYAATLCREEGSGRVLVTHADMIRGFVANLLGLPMDNLLRFEVDPASITTIEVARGHARLLVMNETVMQ